MAELSFLPFLDRVVDFPEGTSYELLRPLTDLRSNQDGTPAEARILFTCRPFKQDAEAHRDDELIVKVKIQEKNRSPTVDGEPEPGPSTTTAAELEALKVFLQANNPYVPHLVTWKMDVQGPNAPYPGGYITYTIMTKMPGVSLFDLRFTILPTTEKDEIVQEFLPALRSVYALGIEPTDRALRNILWDKDARKCSIIDFELWSKSTGPIADETRILQRWGLVAPPTGRGWLAFFTAFELQGG